MQELWTKDAVMQHCVQIISKVHPGFNPAEELRVAKEQEKMRAREKERSKFHNVRCVLILRLVYY